MMENKRKENCKNEVLTLSGDLTIENALELQKVFLKAVDNNKQLSIIFENVTAVDLSFVQLLCAAHRTMVRSGKILQLPDQHPDVLKTAVWKMGFVRRMGCDLDTQESCIWKKGRE